MDDKTAKELHEVALSLDPHQIQQLLRMHNTQSLAPLLDLVENNPAFLESIVTDEVLEEPVLDYVTDLDVRRGLLLHLDRIIHNSKLGCEINMTVFALFMVAPIEQLKSTLKELQENILEKNEAQINQFLSQFQTTCVASVQEISNKGGRPPGSSAAIRSSQATPLQGSPTKRQRHTHERSVSDSKVTQLPATPSRPTTASRPTTPSRPTSFDLPFNPHYQLSTDNTQSLALDPASSAPKTPELSSAPKTPELVATPNTNRSAYAAKLCKQRDGMKCIFTGMEDPQTAHIFPFSGSKGSKIPNIVSTLRTFWGNDTATRFSDIFLNQAITETPQNLLSLNYQLHHWFDNGRMALKPLRKLDNGTVQVQLHWLKTSELKPTQVFNKNMKIQDAVNSAGIKENQSWGTITAHRHSGLPLQTGQVFNLTAKNPDHIPNMEFLQLSWDLLRVAAICGAAEPSDLSDFDDDDDDNGYEVETSSVMYYDDNYAEMSRWAREVENEEEEDREEHPSYNEKSPL